MNDLTDAVVKAKSGDREAFEHLYCWTKDKIYFLCLKFMKNEADALDMVSDTYLTAIEKLHTLQQPEYVETWLKKIAANKCKNYLAKNKEVLFFEQGDMERYGQDIQFEIDEEFIPESYVENKEKRQQIMEIIDNQLSDVQRSVILMYYYGGISIREIAEEMECSEGTVKSRLNSARAVMYKYITNMQKKGVPLFSMGNIPLLVLLLQEEAKNYAVTEKTSAGILQICLAEYGRAFPSMTDSTTREDEITVKSENLQDRVLRKGAGSMIEKTVMTKIAITAGSIAVFGLITTAFLLGSRKEDRDTEYTEQVQTIATKEEKTEEEAESEEVTEKNDKYILPESNVRYIDYTEILDFDTETLNLAKNEIYARHGFIFNVNSIAQYFESCTWYKPSVLAANFKESVFNEYEITNIGLLDEYEKFSSYTYPLEVKNGESVKVDLNGDGKLEKISLSVKEEIGHNGYSEYYDYKVDVTINDVVKKYDCDNMASLYIVDIDTMDSSKEICFETLEPNDFTGSILWQYSTENKLKRIFFSDQMSYRTEDIESSEYEIPDTYWSYGITYLGDGRVTVTTKCISITQYLTDLEYRLTKEGYFEYIDRIYDFSNGLQEYFDNKYEIALTLKRELAIYKEPSELSETFTIKPQELKIVATCKNHDENSYYWWSKVKLEDGSTGWILPTSKTNQTDLEEIFDGVFFSG